MTGSQIFGVGLNRCLRSFIEEMETKRYIEGLIKVLEDEDAFVRYRAAETL